MNQQQQRWRNSGLLLITAIVWGTAFVSQSVGMDYVKPFTFNGIRSLLGGVVLVPVVLFLRKKSKPIESRKTLKTMQGGVVCGILLFAGSTLQQFGILHTTVGKAGFITAFYIVLVPLCGCFVGKAPGLRVWIAVGIALCGLYFLCMNESFAVGQGDIYVFLCAFAFALHILYVDHMIHKVEAVLMACIQFFVCGGISVVAMAIWEKPTLTQIHQGMVPLIYAGVMSCGIGYTLQIVGQKGVNPTIASLILSLESVVSVLAGFIILHQEMTPREMLGCVLMFVAITLAQLPQRKNRKMQQ